MASAKKILRRLTVSQQDQQLVRVTRTPKHSYRIDGFVVAMGAEWVLFARTMDGGFFDGHIAVRVADIRAIRMDKTFEGRMSRTLPDWPPTAPFASIDLDSTAGLLQTVGLKDVLVGIEKENEREAIWIGTVYGGSKKLVWLLEVRPDATWHDKPLTYKLRAITAVTVGSRYLVGLRTIVDLDSAGN